jgi:putative Mn2+ efflux pump MntP
MISKMALVVCLAAWVAVIVLTWLEHQRILSIIFLILLALLGVGEIVSKAMTGRTITQRFKKFMETHPWRGGAILICLGLLMAGLIVHLFPMRLIVP